MAKITFLQGFLNRYFILLFFMKSYQKVPEFGTSFYMDFKNFLIKTICVIVPYAILTVGSLLPDLESLRKKNFVEAFKEVFEDTVIGLCLLYVICEMLATVIESWTIESWAFVFVIGAFFVSGKMVLDVLSTTENGQD